MKLLDEFHAGFDQTKLIARPLAFILDYFSGKFSNAFKSPINCCSDITPKIGNPSIVSSGQTLHGTHLKVSVFVLLQFSTNKTMTESVKFAKTLC